MSFKSTILSILEAGSQAFAQLRAITKWTPETVLANLGVIVEATRDGLRAIDQLRGSLGILVNDEKAQDELAEVLDEAIQLNAMLEAVDGMIFRILVRGVCTAVAPFIVTAEERQAE